MWAFQGLGFLGLGVSRGFKVFRVSGVKGYSFFFFFITI